jgi:hypothetical protein
VVEAALTIIGLMRFTPATSNGVPIEGRMPIRVVLPAHALSTGKPKDDAGRKPVPEDRISWIPISPPDGSATVRIERDRALLGGVLATARLEFDQRWLADVHQGEFLEFHVPLGNHVLNVRSQAMEQRLLGLLPTPVEQLRPTQATFEPGRTYEFRLESDVGGVWSLRPVK